MKNLLPVVLIAVLLTQCAADEPAPTATEALQSVTAQPTTMATSTAPISAVTPIPKNTAAQASHASQAPVSGISREEALEYMYDHEAPDFLLKDLDGNEVSLEKHRGKIIFLNFWQTWCPPCREEMPLFEKLMADNDDLVVLAIVPLAGENASAKRAEADVRELVTANGYTFPVLIEPAQDGGISRHELYASPYVPANYVIDREGILRFAIEGAYTQDMIDMALEYMRALDE